MKKTGFSKKEIMGCYVHYDNDGTRTGMAKPGVSGSFVHYDEYNNITGSTTIVMAIKPDIASKRL